MISFEPTEEQQLIVENVAAFARQRLRPAVRATERARALAPELVAEAVALGLPGMDLPADAGGAGLGLLDAALVDEALAWGDAAAPFALPGAHAYGAVVRELAPPERHAELLAPFAQGEALGAFAWTEPGAHPEALATTARRDLDGWVLDGVKSHCLHAGRATHLAVAAQVDGTRGWDGVGVFLVPVGAPGLTRLGRAGTVGLDGACFGGLRLEGVRVPAGARLGDDEGTARGLARAFLRVALRAGARAVGLARAAAEVALAYTQERHAFGKPVAHFQAVAFTLADRHLEVDAAGLLVRRAAALWDRGAVDPGACAVAAATALRCALRASDDAVQLHGGAGFMRDYLPEKLLRDARTLSLYGMSAAVLDQVVAAEELGLPFDAASRLPTPDVQSVFT
ncbi:MAG: acyl-CoA dehydrogenase family protein [Deltaproteobacteria bacterium]|nr:acyl-CoA dehydrogenase family protein [Deltaproteobacteria bacterium]